MARKHPKNKRQEPATPPPADPKAWWVVGGAYTDREVERGDLKEERYGPFVNYQAALDEWKSRSWAAVDDAWIRYRIVPETALSAG